MNRLEHKVALITGSSSGVGRAMALRFAREGASVICADRTRDTSPVGFEDDKTATDELIVKQGGKAVFVSCDITDRAQIQNAIRTGVAQFGPLDIVCCNAGLYRAGHPFHQIPDEDLDACLNVNIRGTWLSSQAAAAQFLRQGSKGRILITSSSSAIRAYPYQAAYSMSKAAILNIVQSMGLEYGARGIATNAICATGMRTALTRPGADDETYRAAQTGKIPFGRWGEAEDFANLALFLVSDEADYINGAHVVLDGGETLSSFNVSAEGVPF